jgi:hypothetical protein
MSTSSYLGADGKPGSVRDDYPAARWVPVDSGAVRALAFIAAGKLELACPEFHPADTRYGSVLVEYRNGRVYEYKGEHPSVFDAILACASIGAAVNTYLRA